MDIKNKLEQIREGSMSHHFCTDSIRLSSLDYVMKVGLFLCNTPLISSKQTIETNDRNYNLNVLRNQSFSLF